MSAIPVLFTLPPSNRHEIILIDPDAPSTLKTLNKQIMEAIATSPNCVEFMHQYKTKPSTSQQQQATTTTSIRELKIHWGDAGRDLKVWPEYTTVTEENWPAVLGIMKSVGVGRDVLEVRVGEGGE